jgi:hypothetical protein
MSFWFAEIFGRKLYFGFIMDENDPKNFDTYGKYLWYFKVSKSKFTYKGKLKRSHYGNYLQRFRGC